MLYRPGLKLGILGGGQLGQMLLQAAIPFDFSIKVLDPDPLCSCRHLCDDVTTGSFADEKTVLAFGKDCELLTVEIEHVNVSALEQLEKSGVVVYPRPSTLRLVQDKGLQKQFYANHDIPTAEFILVDHKKDLEAHLDFLPAFQKARTQGYDGKGVKALQTIADLTTAFEVPSVLEKKIEAAREIAILLARNPQGEIKIFPAVEMLFHPVSHLVESLISPAKLSESLFQEACEISKKIVTALDYVGVMAVEMFLTQGEKWLVNEIAPRPHNSGHHTIQANVTSQYEQHLRAISGMPLGATESHGRSAMVNLLGEPGQEGPVFYEGHEKILALPGVSVHLYGKKLTKPMRKMGHVTILENNEATLNEKIHYIKQHFKVLSKT